MVFKKIQILFLQLIKLLFIIIVMLMTKSTFGAAYNKLLGGYNLIFIILLLKYFFTNHNIIDFY